MENDLNHIQRKFEEEFKGINKIDRLFYNKSVLPAAAKLADELNEFPKLSSRVDFPISIYIEACLKILVDEYMENINNYEFSLFRDSRVPFHMIVRVLDTHPYLINLLYRNMTDEEWCDYKEKILDELHVVFGERAPASELELLCRIPREEIINPNNSVLHNFHYFMGLTFEEDCVSIKYGKLLEQIGEESGLLVVHVSKRVVESSIVIYNQIDRINKTLILNPDKTKKLNYIRVPNKIYTYDNDYEILNKSSKGFYVCLCYDDAKELINCTFSLAKEGFPMEFMSRYIKGAIPKTLDKEDIDIYLQEWLFELFGDFPEPVEKLDKALLTLQNIAQDNYSDNIDKCIVSILKDKRLKEVIINEHEMGYFRTYIHGLKLLAKTRMVDVVEHVKRYLGDI